MYIYYVYTISDKTNKFLLIYICFRGHAFYWDTVYANKNVKR